MPSWRLGLLALIVLLGLAACAGGQNFTRPSVQSLKLDTTGYWDVVAMYGPPSAAGTSTRNQRVFKTVMYRYMEGRSRGNAYQEGVTPGKQLIYYFLEDTLVGYVFSSSFKEDNTDFDLQRVGSIKRGETTRAGVIELLGPPAGEFVYPFAQNAGNRELMYYYYHLRLLTGPTSTTEQPYSKTFIVTVNSGDIVTDTEFSSSGRW